VGSATGAERENRKTYRRRVFEGLFRRHALEKLAAKPEFMSALADRTDPIHGPLQSPFTRYILDARPQMVPLRTGAEIEFWISETITWFGHGESSPECQSFWMEALDNRKKPTETFP
jgi:hypothetical protein